jgi:hypothetical protein
VRSITSAICGARARRAIPNLRDHFRTDERRRNAEWMLAAGRVGGELPELTGRYGVIPHPIIRALAAPDVVVGTRHRIRDDHLAFGQAVEIVLEDPLANRGLATADSKSTCAPRTAGLAFTREPAAW